MGKKAVYQKKYLAIYVSREEFEKLLSQAKTNIPVQLAGLRVPGAYLEVRLWPSAVEVLNLAYAAEQKAIDDMNAETRKRHPDYENSEQRRKRIKKHAR